MHFLIKKYMCYQKTHIRLISNLGLTQPNIWSKQSRIQVAIWFRVSTDLSIDQQVVKKSATQAKPSACILYEKKKILKNTIFKNQHESIVINLFLLHDSYTKSIQIHLKISSAMYNSYEPPVWVVLHVSVDDVFQHIFWWSLMGYLSLLIMSEPRESPEERSSSGINWSAMPTKNCDCLHLGVLTARSPGEI